MALGANGLLGVGPYQYDCDVPGLPTGPGSSTTFGIGSSNACASSSTPPPGAYYTCPASGCVDSLVPASQQIQNPVSKFATDNNGVILELPSVASGVGGKTLPVLWFSASAPSPTMRLTAAQSSWRLMPTTLTMHGWDFQPSSTMSPTPTRIRIPDSAVTSSTAARLISSPEPGDYWDQHLRQRPKRSLLPGVDPNLTAGNQASGSTIRSEVPFFVSDPSTLPAGTTAFSDLAAPDTSGLQNFVWGLPFFYGRNVYTAIWGATSPSGVPPGPFWAY